MITLTAPSLNPSADVVYNEIWKQNPLMTDSWAYSHLQLSTARQRATRSGTAGPLIFA